MGSVDTLSNGVVVIHNPQEGVWDSRSAWRPVEEVRIGQVDSRGPDAFGQIWSAPVEDALGRIWVLDRQAVALPVFGPDGEWIRTIGREGGGPGEFRSPLAVVRGPENRMWVVDPGNTRYSAFDTAGNLVASWRREILSSSLPWPGGIDTQGRLHDYAFSSVPRTTRSLVRHEFRDTTVIVDTIPLPEPPAAEDIIRGPIPGGFVTVSIPYGSRFIWAFVPDGRILYGMSGDYRIHVAPLGGEPNRVIEREATPDAVTREQRQQGMEGMSHYVEQGLDFDASMIPDAHPVVAAFFMDDRGYLWVQPHQPPAESDDPPPGLRLVPWDIFDPDGRYLGRIPDLPPLISVRGASVVGSTTDELGVPYVIGYRLEGR